MPFASGADVTQLRPRTDPSPRVAVGPAIASPLKITAAKVFMRRAAGAAAYNSAFPTAPSSGRPPDPSCRSGTTLDATGVGHRVRLLEIGTDWGELAIRAARRGARVTTVTLSHQQAALTRNRVAAAGLDRRVEVRVPDYRQVTGSFHAIISVEMIEAVGPSWWPTYFQTLDQHLAASGRVGLQSILMDHDRMLDASRSWTWTRKYLFPGGVIPSQTAIETSLAHQTILRVIDRYHFGASYARTLRERRHRFNQHRDQLDRLGFDTVFQRMWNYYLAQSQAAFQAGYLDVGQLILTRTNPMPPRNP